jgi:hypothetical protein
MYDALPEMEKQLVLAVHYDEMVVNREPLTSEELELYFDLVDRLETMCAIKRGISLKRYRAQNNIFPYARGYAKQMKSFKFDEKVNLCSFPREDA